MNVSPSAPHVLIVDDEASNIAILDRLFRPEYRTTTATRGVAALQLLEQDTFDLVLLDIMMPLVSGLDVLKSIRQNPRTAELPVILISARMDENDIVQGLSIGANDYITKPFRLAELRARARTQITLKRLQDERKETIDELKAAHELKDRFLRIASHDLKGPLSNLRLAHYLLRKYVTGQPRPLEMLDNADVNIETMQTVIDEFLDMTALQSGKIELKLSDVAVEGVVGTLLKQYQLNALKKDITVESHVSGVVRADHARMEQALGNLVSNALKYSPRGSVVSIWSEVDGEFVRISVCDQGPGVPESERERLFTQFGKLSARPTDGESSTGLGLWIAKHLTQIQGGEIGVDSPAGGGSTFWIEMPAAVVHEAG